MRIGVLGGTFDPPHLGHLRLAQAAIAHLELDEVLLMPAQRNPMKEQAQATARQRLEMTRLLASGHPGLAVSDMEITRGGPSYAVETMAELQMTRQAEYWFLVGADALKGLPDWKQPKKLLRMCRIGVALRWPIIEAQLLGSMPEEFRSAIDLIPMPRADISATEVRDRLSKGKPTSDWIEPEVLTYIREKGLYGTAVQTTNKS
ncbi:MAG: nicotinate-nucleotide adenylyltransferase [Fimbriimonadaceae bacterium]